MAGISNIVPTYFKWAGLKKAEVYGFPSVAYRLKVQWESSHWNSKRGSAVLIVMHPTDKEKEGEGGYSDSRTQMCDVVCLLDNKHWPLRRFSHSSDRWSSDIHQGGCRKKHKLEITYFSTTRETSKWSNQMSQAHLSKLPTSSRPPPGHPSPNVSTSVRIFGPAEVRHTTMGTLSGL